MLEEDGHGGAAVEESARRGRAQSAAEGAGYGGQGAEECGVEGQEAVEAGHVENSVTVGDDGNRRDAMTPSLRGGGVELLPALRTTHFTHCDCLAFFFKCSTIYLSLAGAVWNNHPIYVQPLSI